MNPFATIPNSQEYFFPNITDEYRAMVRSQIVIRDEHYGYNSDSEMITSYEDQFDLQKPQFKTLPFRPVRSIKEGNTFSVLSFFSSANVNSLVKCVNRDAAPIANASNTHQNFEFVHVGVEESLRDKKFVLVLCVFLPIKWSQLDVGELTRLSLVSSELLSSQPNFEMVLVAKMRTNDTTGDDFDEVSFNHFLRTAFPSRLAVPYSSHEARDILCQKLGFDGNLRGILVDNDKRHPNHRVLVDDIGLFVEVYASIGSPLTYERFQHRNDNPPFDVSLAWLLRCDPSHHLNNMGSSKYVSIEQLSKKLVGLYLCQRGDKLRSLQEVHHQCRLKGLDFEIVFVCMPFLDCMDPYVFQEEIYALANESDLDISSWWVVPYRISTCVRLWRLDYPPWCMKTCDMFREWYDSFKKRHDRSRFELVLVCGMGDIDDHPLMKRPPRGVRPLHYISDSRHKKFLESHSAFFKWVCCNKVETGLDPPAVISFRKNGRINMLNALVYLVPHGRNEDPFDPECRNHGYEVVRMMSETLEFMEEFLDDV